METPINNRAKLVLIYIRNGQETLFPVQDIDQAFRIADAIADSDLLNDAVDYNLFDVYHYPNGKIGDQWESPDGDDYEEYRRLKTAWATTTN